MTILVGLWELLYGNSYTPEFGAIGQLVKLYGGFATNGPERLAVKMLDMSGRDYPGGPFAIIMADARKGGRNLANEEAMYPVVTAPHSFPKSVALDEPINWATDLEM